MANYAMKDKPSKTLWHQEYTYVMEQCGQMSKGNGCIVRCQPASDCQLGLACQHKSPEVSKKPPKIFLLLRHKSPLVSTNKYPDPQSWSWDCQLSLPCQHKSPAEVLKKLSKIFLLFIHKSPVLDIWSLNCQQGLACQHKSPVVSKKPPKLFLLFSHQ